MSTLTALVLPAQHDCMLRTTQDAPQTGAVAVVSMHRLSRTQNVSSRVTAYGDVLLRPAGALVLGSVMVFCWRTRHRRRSSIALGCYGRVNQCAERSVDKSRRQLFASAAMCVGIPETAKAAITGSFRETISDVSSSLGGAPGDVYYPRWLLGNWSATCELVAVETPQGDRYAGDEALKARALLGSPSAQTMFPLRFKTYRDKVIADRLYNVRSLLLAANGVDVVKSIESVEWDPTNANALTVSFVGGDGFSSQKEFYVRARAVGAPDGRDDLFNASEQYQDVSISTRRFGETAAVSPRRRVTKFKLVAGPQVQLVQRIEVYPSIATPDGVRDFGAGFSKIGEPGKSTIAFGNADMGDTSKPIAIYRYRMLLVPTTSTSEPDMSSSFVPTLLGARAL